MLRVAIPIDVHLQTCRYAYKFSIGARSTGNIPRVIYSDSIINVKSLEKIDLNFF